VVVNDLGGDRDGTGSGTSMADGVVAEIEAAGGKAVANYGSVSNKDHARSMVQAAVDNFGKLDICICNAGILRDKSFKNMTDEMWEVVNDVHLRGTYYSAKAAYDQMLAQGRGGRIVVTSSTSGLLGNFGQTNYGAAKAGIAGFARCLYLEGARYGITVNILAPTALSRLTDDILPEQAKDAVPPEKVSPTVAWLCTDEAASVSNQIIHCASGLVGIMQQPALIKTFRKSGVWSLDELDDYMPELVAARQANVTDAASAARALEV